MATDKIQIKLENGELADAQAPVIISASRSTDIPAFYADWFLHRLKVGYSAWTNPFNGVKSYVAYDNTRLIVFWSKNPKPLIAEGGCLDYLAEQGINCYIQYTLNDYVTPPKSGEKSSTSSNIGVSSVNSLLRYEVGDALRKDIDVFTSLLQEFDMNQSKDNTQSKYTRCFACTSAADEGKLSDFVFAVEEGDTKTIMYMAGEIVVK